MTSIISNKILYFYIVVAFIIAPATPVYASQENNINVRITVITPPCKINHGQDIIVNFGDSVVTTQIDGSYKKIPIEYTIDCASATSPDLKMTISGNGAGFDKTVLATDNSDLGIAIYHDTALFPINSSVEFNLAKKLKLDAALVKQKGSVLMGGKFSASATMSIEYQ